MDTIALYSEQPSWGSPDSTTLWPDRDEPSPWLTGLDIRDFGGDPARAASSLGIDGISPYCEEVTEELTDEAHELGLRVVPWTVNTTADMEKMYEMGVDGIITDRPWLLRSFLESKGENIRPVRKIALPYHLEPDHLEAPEIETENGQDAAY